MLSIFLPYLQTKEWWPVIFIAGTGIYYLVYKMKFRLYLHNFFKAHGKAIIVQSLQLIAVVLILLSQNFKGDFAPYLFSFFISSLATVVPVSIGGLGMREYVIVNAAAIFGMDTALGVFMTLCFYIISTFAALTGVLFVYRSKEFEPMPDEKQVKAIEDDAEKVVSLR